jgi:hypothetical protein
MAFLGGILILLGICLMCTLIGFLPGAVLVFLGICAVGASRIGRSPSRGLVHELTHRRCPHCAEEIHHEAKVCIHCHNDIPPRPPRQSLLAASICRASECQCGAPIA